MLFFSSIVIFMFLTFNRNCKGSMSSMNSKKLIKNVLELPKWPDTWPFITIDFRRQDETPDSEFYKQPRLVYHIDDPAVNALKNYYSTIFSNDAKVLDICSSWVSHFPENIPLSNTVGLGMNEFELKQNKQLTQYVVRDLNKEPTFPFDDNSFDFVTCVVSVDYLIRPLEVFSEIKRVLKPNGLAVISQSNRCFPSKAINIWLNSNIMGHVFIAGAYFHYTNGFGPIEAFDISPNAGMSDPMYIIQARKI